jgi:nucleoid-associated protein YgaU
VIFEGSRFQGGAVRTLPDKRGNYQTGVYRDNVPVSTVVQTVVAPDNVRLDQVAFRMFGDATLWWAIADANPDVLWFDEIPPGTLLRIPSAPVR